MEKTVVFCLSELDRQKGKGLVLKQPPEKTLFICQTAYPLWIISWNDAALVFDGLNIVAHTLAHEAIPDVKAFIQDIEDNSRTLESYAVFLSSSLNYFQAPINERKVTLAGLTTDPAFLDELGLYLQDAKRDVSEPAELTPLPPSLDESSFLYAKQELESLNLGFKEEVKQLHESIRFVNKNTNRHLKDLRDKIKTARNKYNEEIRKEEVIVAPKISKIHEQHAEEITKLSEKYDVQLAQLHKEQIKLKKIEEQTMNKIEHYKIESKVRSSNKDAVGEQRRKEKIDEGKAKLSTLKKQEGEIQKQLDELEEKKSLELFNLRLESEAKVNEAKKGLLELESSRDAQIKMHKQEMNRLETFTSTMIRHVNEVAKRREADVSRLEQLGLQYKVKSDLLVYVPFYVVCYQSEKGRRYSVIPPSIVNSVNIVVKFKGALSKTRLRQVFAPKFKAISSFLARLPVIAQQNPAMERTIYESCEKADFLKTRHSIEQLKTGLERLRNEGWLSAKEHDAFVKALNSVDSTSYG